ncbi:MAG: SEC-C metal-binding domain-containing protein [Clostridium sp.]|uniref:SEC-C metal-binding domain-containing protein n=1 Tax=Clostridium sp. TaxID=1506 RepID=UPI0030743DFE
MSAYSNWTEYVVEFVKENGEPEFWKQYAQIEKSIYIKALNIADGVISGKFAELAKHFEVSEIYFMGFLDGINESIDKELDLEAIENNTEINFKIDFEKLYYNMLDSKADYLYTLPQWDRIFSVEKRKEIQKTWRESKTVVNEVKIGRNDPCTCGSGKKYKKCCGK